MNMSSAPIDFEGSAEPVEGSLLNEVAIFPFGGSMFDWTSLKAEKALINLVCWPQVLGEYCGMASRVIGVRTSLTS